ncbi:uncharacterized protein LOC133179742 [Saccostrea echinata]|uniref:uncharacterized protein LOC133179742 n=1 Tax=Saccostrea echinata TaxID=191078 RepID=UPI002A816B34|nr:uncharacterized protein LOC133179742 [Saccostrea echinata]
MKGFEFLQSGYRLLIENAKSRIQSLIAEAQEEDRNLHKYERQSDHSFNDIPSLSSQNTSILARKRAKAEAAKVSLEFAIQEAELRKDQARLIEKHLLEEATAKAAAARKKAEIDAELELLTLKRKAAETKTEADFLESEHSRSSSKHSSIHSLPKDDPMLRTEKYIDQLSKDTEDKIRESEISKLEVQHVNAVCTNPNTKDPPDRHCYMLNPEAPPYVPNPYTPASDFTKFLLKKDLLLTRLVNFNDRPESFASWKSSFQTVMRELGVNPNEEIDLLVKWLGPDSQKHALTLKMANISNPERGLHRIWNRLEERFGAAEMVESALKEKLNSFPRITKNYKMLYDLADVLTEIESVMEDPKYRSVLAYYDSSSGVSPIVGKLPLNLQEKWTSTAIKYIEKNGVLYPPFTFFAEFVRKLSSTKNNPSFKYDPVTSGMCQKENKFTRDSGRVPRVTILKTEMSPASKGLNKETKSGLKKADESSRCQLHNANHPLNKCRSFRNKSLEERRKFLKEKGICFRCCSSTTHIRRNCKETVSCEECSSGSHPTALHPDEKQASSSSGNPYSLTHYGGEKTTEAPALNVNSACTQICKDMFQGKSCAKTVLVRVFRKDHPEIDLKTYAIIDDQSNRSLASPEFFDYFGVHDGVTEYTLASCMGIVNTSGRKAFGFIVESLDGSKQLALPTVIECEHIPNDREEIPTSDVAASYPHLADIARHFTPLDEDAQILLLIGRDLLEAHYVLDQRIGPENSPLAQRLPLGWTMIGETCLGGAHEPKTIQVNKTYILSNGRASLLKPCQNEFNLKERSSDNFGQSVFDRTDADEKPGLSSEDRKFLEIMDQNFTRDVDGFWTAPLPFRQDRERLPNNITQALKRAKSLHISMERDPIKKRHMFEFMSNILDKHAELAPPVSDGKEYWYLPVFGVYHPRKPDKIRGVFDSSAKHCGISLNDVLMSGPDLTNSLLGVLMRFRQDTVAVMTDVEQMFYCFRVQEEHRDYLRFLWYRNNNPEEDLAEYKMKVHVFGNSPSPAVATYGLRKVAEISSKAFGEDVKLFVERDFYVDDGLTSLCEEVSAVDLIKRTQQALLNEGNLRLHKIVSNSRAVMNSFESRDLAKGLEDVDIGAEELPVQRSLGICWNLNSDSFLFLVSADEKPFTRRGVLSTINSIFDPLGFLTPVVIEGKMLLRTLVQESIDWDEPLPDHHKDRWQKWKNSLAALEQVRIPRTYTSTSIRDCPEKSIHVYSDASEKAIAAVAYIKTGSTDGREEIGFLLGKAKLAPSHGHTIPRYKVTLGYIHNQVRRFYTYVSNRVARIHQVTSPKQWTYVPTDSNPADLATRSIAASELSTSTWLLGPSHLRENIRTQFEPFDLQNPDSDKEIRPLAVVSCRKTEILESKTKLLGSHRFRQFSQWTRLVEIMCKLKHIAQSFTAARKCKGWHLCAETQTLDSYKEAESMIIRCVQQESFSTELQCLERHEPLPRNTQLRNLDPFIGADGLLRVGGRLNLSNIQQSEKNPVIIPSRNYIATLLVRFYHEKCKHQGRHITAGAVRMAGFWILGGKRLVSTIIYHCVTCRKLRRQVEHQKMADLPSDRLEPAPPFTNVGLDVFGPWSVVTRRTKGGAANSKRWAVLFTCLSTRGVHIEVIEELSSSSFINAFKRFMAIRGPVKIVRSDRGTNFVGATDDLCIDTVKVEDHPVMDFLYDSGVVWIFNPPHASHMGGVWERLIGVTRRILDAMLLGTPGKALTHEVLTTFLAEVSAIINSRPLVGVSSDPEDPYHLSPSLLLTQKPDVLVPAGLSFDEKDSYKVQWKKVQYLADVFWSKWKKQYLQTLQERRKWQTNNKDLRVGDVVLLKDELQNRIYWPMGLVTRTFPGSDGRVRKIEVRTIRDGKPTEYVRPVNQVVLLISET